MKSLLQKQLTTTKFVQEEKSILSLQDIVKTFDGKRNVLDNIQFSVQHGEFALIEGKSGSGKSTFLNIVGLLDTPTKGDYFLDGKRLNTKRIHSFSRIRSERIGFIFQSYQLIEKLSVKDNILLPYLYMKNNIDSTVLQKMDEMLCRFNLLDMKNKEVALLSGGEKQRVAIARAIIKKADIIIADEPTGNLDAENSKIIVEEFKVLKEQNKAVIVVTHNPYYFTCADRNYTLDKGRLC